MAGEINLDALPPALREAALHHSGVEAARRARELARAREHLRAAHRILVEERYGNLGTWAALREIAEGVHREVWRSAHIDIDDDTQRRALLEG